MSVSFQYMYFTMSANTAVNSNVINYFYGSYVTIVALERTNWAKTIFKTK